MESSVGAGHFSCLDLKLGFWQIKIEEVLKQYTAFTLGNLGFFICDCMPFGHIPKADADLPGQTKPCLLSHLPR